MSRPGILRHLLQIQEVCKGKLKPDEYFELLALFLALVARHPELVERTATMRNEPAECQAFFSQQLDHLFQNEPTLPWNLGEHRHVIGPILAILAQLALQYRAELPNIASCIRRYYAEQYHKPSRLEFQKAIYFQSMLGNIANLSLLDSHCGLGFKSLLLNPKQHVLNEQDKQLSQLGYRLHLAGGRPDHFLNEDYLKASCTHQDSPSPDSESYSPLLSAPECYDIALVEPPGAQPLNEESRLYFERHFPFLLKPEGELPSTATLSLWIQQTLRQLKPNGKAYIVVPNGWLSRGGYDGQFRHYLLENGHIESVSAIDEDIQEQSQTSLLILRKAASKSRPVIFMDHDSALLHALYQVEAGSSADIELTPPDLTPTYSSRRELSIRDILRQDTRGRYADLQPNHFLVEAPTQTISTSLATEQAKLIDAQSTAEAAQQALQSLMDKYRSQEG